MAVRLLQLEKIRIDGGTQMRAELSEETVREYAVAMQGGANFPSVVVFHDGRDHWLADGFHRFHASRSAKFPTIYAEVSEGTRIDAVKHALGANIAHGIRRTNRDKQKCVETALMEFPALNDQAIADLCGVSDRTVSTYRKASSETFGTTSPAKIGRDGKLYPVTKTTGAPKAAHVRPIPEYSPTKEQQAAADEAAKDSKQVSSLKFHWGRAGKRDRARFLTWAEKQANPKLDQTESGEIVIQVNEANRLWTLAKMHLDKIIPEDIGREKALEEILAYVTERIARGE